ncbi:uracil-DNA glycosylase family protein [Candidatus Bathyarchaeota archaeon]|nr:uracil-DNA glycosylase family protein [Candidatus Bathyarchaeota archaeon]
MEFSRLRRRIEELGNQLVNCRPITPCEDVVNDPESGRIPRCLVLEERSGAEGVVIVGINPGQAKPAERKFFMNERSYSSMLSIWKEHVRDRRYYKGLREVADSLGYTGPILWTELVKCQSEKKGRRISPQTMRSCISRYLEKELAIFSDFPIIAVGNQAFDYCSLRFADRFVIGIPHPTGSFGTFCNLFYAGSKGKRLKDKYARIIEEKRRSKPNPAIRLFPG